jgi:WD40 repeat protein
MYCSYEGAIDLDAITNPAERSATEGMISNFGQTPTQLIKAAHPRRKSRAQSIKDKIHQGKPIILWHQINHLKAYYVELSDPKNPAEILDPVIFISIPRNHVKSFMQQGLSDPLLSISQSGVIGVNGWQAYERSLTNLFSFEKDPSLLSDKTKKSIAGPFEPNYEITTSLFVFTHDSKLLISGGHWDNSLRVFSMSKYRTVGQIYQHSDTVTCLAQDYTGTVLVSGSKDTTVMVWEIRQEYSGSVGVGSTPVHILYGHTACVTSVGVSLELDIVVSGSLDGTVNMHTVHKGHFVRSISFGGDDIGVECTFSNIMVRLSNQRHLLVYTSGVVRDATSSGKRSTHNLYLYSINGKMISSERLGNPLQDMIIKGDYCILAVLVRSQAGKAVNGNGGYIAASKIVFKENYE